MINKFYKLGPTLWVSFILIAVGILLLLENLDLYYISDIWDYWPLIFVIVGIAKLLSSQFKDLYSSSILIIVGLLLFSVTNNWLRFYEIWQFWPVILILIGGRIIYNKLRTGKAFGNIEEDGVSDDYLDDVAVFGGKEKRITSQMFRGGNIVVLFGGMEIYFDNARLAEGKNEINVVVMFGGAELYVPRDWKVVTSGLPIFGGFEDKRGPQPSDELSPKQELIIRGVVLFGGLELKNI